MGTIRRLPPALLLGTLLFAALPARAGQAGQDAAFSGGETAELKFADKIVRKPRRETAEVTHGGITGAVEKVTKDMVESGNRTEEKEDVAASLSVRIKPRLVKGPKPWHVKLRVREESWSVSANMPRELLAALEADRRSVLQALAAWDKTLGEEELARLEKGEAVPCVVDSHLQGLRKLSGAPVTVKVANGAYEISGFSIVDEAHKNRQELTEKVKAAEAKVKAAGEKNDRAQQEYRKRLDGEKVDRDKLAAKKVELDHARWMRDYEPEVRDKLREVEKAAQELTGLRRMLVKSGHYSDIEKRKKQTGLPADATDEDLLKVLHPDSTLARDMRADKELRGRLARLEKELDALRAKFNAKHRVDKLQAEYDAMEKGQAPPAEVEAAREAAEKALKELDAANEDLQDLKFQLNRARAFETLALREVVVTGDSGVVYRAEPQDIGTLYDELQEAERRLKAIRKDLEETDAARGQAKEEAIAASNEVIAARGSWTVWLYNAASYFSQAAVSLGIEVFDVAKAGIEGGPAGAAAEILKKAGERIVSGVVFGKWGEEYREANQDVLPVMPEFLHKKDARVELAGMSAAKGVLGRALEPAEEVTWAQFVRSSTHFGEVKKHFTDLKSFKMGAGEFLKGAVKNAVGEMITDGLIKDRIKDNLQQACVDFFSNKAYQQYAEAEIRAGAAVMLWRETSTHYWNARDAYLTQLKERDKLSQRFKDRIYTKVTEKKKLSDGTNLRIELLPTPASVPKPDGPTRRVDVMLGEKKAVRTDNPQVFSYKVLAADLNEAGEGDVELQAHIEE